MKTEAKGIPMEYVNIIEAARRSGKSDKTIRRAIHAGKLPAHFPQPNRCEIALRDLDAFLHGQGLGPSATAQEQRIAELAERVEALEAQVQSLLGRQEMFKSHRVTPTAERTTGLLPRHLVDLSAFTQKHNVAETKVHAAIQIGLLPVKRGEWRRGDGSPVRLALDAKGKHAFHQLYHDVPPFLACEQCPHPIARQAVSIHPHGQDRERNERAMSKQARPPVWTEPSH